MVVDVDTVLKVIKIAKDLADAVKSNKVQMVKLKNTINGVIEGLNSYMSLTIGMDEDSKLISNLRKILEDGLESIKTINDRYLITKYLYASSDKDDISKCIELLECALKALRDKIKLANEAAIRGTNRTLEEINFKALNSLKTAEGKSFWRNFVHDKNLYMNTQKAAYYLANYINFKNVEGEIAKD
jgi:hypothetical protein